MISLIDLCSALLGLLCVFLATRAKKENFFVGCVYSILLFFLFMHKHLYSSMLLQPISLALNIYGYHRWTHPKQGEANEKKELKISLLGWGKRGLYVCGWVVFALGWGFVLSRLHLINEGLFPPARQPYLDAFITATFLTAQLLSAKKVLECWACWGTANVTNFILYLRSGLVFMPLVATAYTVMAVFGFLGWRRKWKKNL
ncbi:MAG: nicotinamide riboside transporter PnuC [Prevotellaceae bacterium]|jgi:nicotinamide mononucleotide transporter|nr:nicotinamide riboside transporter PnuC [Prevotellaceae bacterium]